MVLMEKEGLCRRECNMMHFDQWNLFWVGLGSEKNTFNGRVFFSFTCHKALHGRMVSHCLTPQWVRFPPIKLSELVSCTDSLRKIGCPTRIYVEGLPPSPKSLKSRHVTTAVGAKLNPLNRQSPQLQLKLKFWLLKDVVLVILSVIQKLQTHLQQYIFCPFFLKFPSAE